VSVGDDVRAYSDGSPTHHSAARPGPLLVADPAAASGTGLLLFPQADALPSAWVTSEPAGLQPEDAAALLAAVRPCSLLPEHGEGWFGRPGLSGHRLGHGAGRAATVRAARRPDGTGRRCSGWCGPRRAATGLASRLRTPPPV